MSSDKASNGDLMRADLQQSLKRSPVNPRNLSSFQRILLTTDGTVTEMLEAVLWERMKVVKLSQELLKAEEDLPLLEAKKGTGVLDRRILLRGVVSHKNHIYAESLVLPDRLSDHMKDALLNSAKPIGLLILEERLETFREIMDCGKEPAGHVAQYFDIPADSFLIYRTYRVFAHRHPIMQVTEKFPESGPAHDI